MRIYIYITLTLFVGISRAKDIPADKDLIIVVSCIDHCHSWAEEYHAYKTGAPTPLEKQNRIDYVKNQAANIINSELLKLWLMYIGPWKFDISKDTTVQKLIDRVRSQYRQIANEASQKNDPLDVLKLFDTKHSMPIANQYPDGAIPNFDPESIKTRQNYLDLVSAYHRWLNGPVKKD